MYELSAMAWQEEEEEEEEFVGKEADGERRRSLKMR